MEQPEFNFSTTRQEVDAELNAALRQERVLQLHEVLRADGGWVSSKRLIEAGFGERELRTLTEHDKDGTIFSFPGSPGYKHIAFVTMEEFDRCNALKTQAKRMLERFVRYESAWHRRHFAGDAARRS